MPELEVAVYRLIQEALTNVVKHAGARRVTVRVEDPRGDGQVIVEVSDDGRGFDPDDPGAGFGLLGMRERVALVGGELEVRAAPGKGTSVIARIPVQRRVPEPRGSVTPAG